MDGITDLREKYLTAIAAASDEAGLEEVRLAALGKKGEVSGPDARPRRDDRRRSARPPARR